MTHSSQDSFERELMELVERYRDTRILTYSELVGCLMLKMHEMSAEALAENDEPVDD